MAGKYDGSVLINTKLETSDAEKQTHKLGKEIEGLDVSLRASKKSVAPLVKRLDELTYQADAAAKKLHEMQNAPVGTYSAEQISEQAETVRALGVHWNETQRQVQKYGKEIANTSAKLDQAKAKYGELQQQIIATEQSSIETASEMEQARNRMQSFASETAQVFKNAGVGFSDIFKNAFSSITSKMSSMLKSIPGKFSSMAKKVGSALKTITKGVLTVSKNLNVFSKLSGALSGTMKRLGRTIKQAFVFSVIYKGLSMIKEQVSSYLMVNKEFSAALSQVKGALLTAFQPIYEVVVPALTTLLNVLSRVIAVVTQFTASLFGTTAKQAQSNAKALYEQANATEEAGSAAEKAAGSLASFDEINTLSSGSSSGGGTTAGAETAPTFETELDDTVFDTWGQAFDAFLDNLLNKGIPSLEAGLSAMSEKINNFSKKLLEMFAFPGVVDKVKEVGKSLANAINSFVLSVDWNQLGQAIGAGLNTAIAFAVAFLYSVDWQNIGASLAGMLNGIVSQIDWYSFGALLFAGFKIGIETLAGFILGLDMPSLAQSASELVIGFMDSITETLAGIDWQGIGRQVKEFLVNIDWAGVAESTFTSIGAAFGALTAFLWGLIQDAWKEIVNWWHDVAYEDGKFTLQGLLDGIVDVIKNIGSWLKEHVVDPFVDGFKKLFGIHSPSTVMAELGSYLMEGLKEGALSMLASVLEVFSGLKSSVLNIFSGLWDGMKTVINSIIGGVEWMANKVIDGINSVIKALNKVSFTMPSWLGGGTFGFNISTLRNISIPRLAEGAVIPPNREFLAVLGDQKSGTNIETPEALLRKIVREETGGEAKEIHITVITQLDGREVARNTVRHVNDMTRERGKPVILV